MKEIDWIFNRFIGIINSLGMLKDKVCKSQLKGYVE